MQASCRASIPLLDHPTSSLLGSKSFSPDYMFRFMKRSVKERTKSFNGMRI
jgi:hypothetical protein